MKPTERDLARVDALLRDHARAPAPAIATRVAVRVAAGARRSRPSLLRPLMLVGAAAAVLVVVGGVVGFSLAERAPVAMSPSPLRTVHFALEAPGAKTVVLVGDFNGWSADRGLTLTARDGDRFVATAELPPGRYAYAFVVDGERVVVDPSAPAFEPDGFGGRNSVLEL